MFEDLNWRWAARRAAVVIAIYLGLFYFLSVAFPDSGFSLQRPGAVRALLFNATVFFFIFTLIYAFVERSRRRRLTEMRKKPEKPSGEDSEAEPGSLKGQPNPNTSRKKARRRR